MIFQILSVYGDDMCYIGCVQVLLRRIYENQHISVQIRMYKTANLNAFKFRVERPLDEEVHTTEMGTFMETTGYEGGDPWVFEFIGVFTHEVPNRYVLCEARSERTGAQKVFGKIEDISTNGGCVVYQLEGAHNDIFADICILLIQTANIFKLI